MRGQGYDNAATMAGVHSGVQRRIMDINPLATYVPCNNHSLNLAGVHSAQASVNATTSLGRWIVSSCSSQHQPTDGMYSSNTSRERPLKGPGRPDGARDTMQSMRWRRVHYHCIGATPLIDKTEMCCHLANHIKSVALSENARYCGWRHCYHYHFKLGRSTP